MTPITWRGLTADYTDNERATMRTLPAKEATIIHELKALLDARIIDTRPLGMYAGKEGHWDERRNTSMARQTHRYEDVAADIGAYEPPVEPDQLRMDEAA